MNRYIAITAFTMFSIVLMFGCNKDNSIVVPRLRTLTYISEVGDLTYNNGLLETYGDYRLLYNRSELTGLRKVTHDTVVNKNP